VNQSTATETDARGPFERVDTTQRDWMTGDEYYRSVFDDVADARPSDPDAVDTFPTLHTNRGSIARGELWLTSSHFCALWDVEYGCERPKIVLIMKPDMDGEDPYDAGPDYRRAEGLPVSLQHQFATRDDLLIEDDDSPFGTGFIVQADMPVTVLRAQLSACVGSLAEAFTREAELLHLRAHGFLSTPAGKELGEYIEENVLTGTASNDDAVSMAFKAQERRNLLYLSRAEADLAVWLRRREAEEAAVALLPATAYGLRSTVTAMTDAASALRDRLHERWLRFGQSADAAYTALEASLVPARADASNELTAAEARAMRAYAEDFGIVNVYNDDANLVDVVTTEDGHFLYILPERPSNVVRIERLVIDGESFRVPGSIPGERTPADADRAGWIMLLPVLLDDATETAVEAELYIDEKPVHLVFRARTS
jgi:hypothetical protein